MDGMTNNVRAHYTGDDGSKVADRVRALLETLGPGRVPLERLAALEGIGISFTLAKVRAGFQAVHARPSQARAESPAVAERPAGRTD
jgi:hypothetical protein